MEVSVVTEKVVELNKMINYIKSRIVLYNPNMLLLNALYGLDSLVAEYERP